jgi:hypothetical protein
VGGHAGRLAVDLRPQQPVQRCCETGTAPAADGGHHGRLGPKEHRRAQLADRALRIHAAIGQRPRLRQTPEVAGEAAEDGDLARALAIKALQQLLRHAGLARGGRLGQFI